MGVWLMIASLYNIFTDERGMNEFAFANADLHYRQNIALYKQKTLASNTLPYYVLDPLALNAGFVNWLQLHQDIHTKVNSLLGIAGNDLTDVDFRKPEQLASWVFLHAQEHLQAANKLGIS
jgi:hypothetical protein